MMQRRSFLLGSAAAAFAALGHRAGAQEADALSARLRQATGDLRGTVAGMVAIAVEEGGAQLASFGSSGVDGLAMDADTVFEIGSITKVLTALLLADMAERGEVALDDPVTRHLPASVLLQPQGRPITLSDLASYTAGLPDMPPNMPPGWETSDNPLSGYATDMLFEFLSGYRPEHAAGAHYEYSNVAFALLGAALAHRAGKSYEALLVERICDPLGLQHTRIALTPAMQARVAQGHELDPRIAAPLWDMPGLQGAGAVRSTAGDMAVFLRACMGVDRTPLERALARLLQTRRPTPLAGTDAALGWFVSAGGGAEIVWKTGVTGGFTTCIAFSPSRRRGAAVLANFLSRPEGGGAIDATVLGIAASAIEPGFTPGDLRLLY